MGCKRCGANMSGSSDKICKDCAVKYNECIGCQGQRITEFDSDPGKIAYGCETCMIDVGGKNWRDIDDL